MDNPHLLQHWAFVALLFALVALLIPGRCLPLPCCLRVFALRAASWLFATSALVNRGRGSWQAAGIAHPAVCPPGLHRPSP
jgi:hypothetical protein